MHIAAAVITFLVMFSCEVSFAQSPPFRKVTISGAAKAVYNKVSLFESGSSKAPFKTEYDRSYSIGVAISY